MLRRLYAWTLGLAGHRRAPVALAAVSFAESSVFPIPPDVLLIPMVLAAPAKAWRIAGVCTAASVLGGLAGYAIGYYAFEVVGRPIVEFYGYASEFAEFQGWYARMGWWIVVGGGFTPFPYKVVTILSGVAALDPVSFIIASALSRGLRFFAVAALLWRFGAPLRGFLEAHLGKLTAVFFVLLVGGFLAVKFLL